MHDGSIKACFDKTIGKATLASLVKASFDAPTPGPLHMTSVLNLMALRLEGGFPMPGKHSADRAPLTADPVPPGADLADLGASIGP